jgi:hypothetical protein
MKISIGTNIKQGPWGGGNLFAINLKNFLEEKGHEVIHDLEDEDIDVILITEPRKTSESSAFTHIDVRNYLDYVKKDAIVVHRFNECDERKGTNFVNKYLINANKYSDHNVFVSKWLKELYLGQGLNNQNNVVIYAGANNEVFNSINYKKWNGDSKISFVTHHWGANWNKGFSIYTKLDELLEDPYWKDIIEFTYIGNLPKNYSFKNAKHIKPLSGHKLAKEIKKSHAYITASLNEPSGNHHIEAAQCGLPIMYIDSGGTPEYCKEFGEVFKEDNFENKLRSFISSYSILSDKMKNYPHSSDIMCNEYEILFQNLVSKKEMIVASRNYTISEGISNKIIFKLKRNINKKFKF